MTNEYASPAADNYPTNTTRGGNVFKLKCKAEVAHLNVRGETHGDETVPAMDVKLVLISVPVKSVTSAIANIESLYNGKDIIAPEANPLTVNHKLENMAVEIGDVKLKGADIKKGMKIELLHGGRANVTLSVQIQHAEAVAVELLKLLGETVDAKLDERQQRLEAVQ